VVFRVAVTGKPSCSAALVSLDFAPVTGGVAGAPLDESFELCLREQPDRRRAASTAARDAERGTAGRVVAEA
jgi:hypothetical protein